MDCISADENSSRGSSIGHCGCSGRATLLSPVKNPRSKLSTLRSPCTARKRGIGETENTSRDASYHPLSCKYLRWCEASRLAFKAEASFGALNPMGVNHTSATPFTTAAFERPRSARETAPTSNSLKTRRASQSPLPHSRRPIGQSIHFFR